jgi:hypothetical protein
MGHPRPNARLAVVARRAGRAGHADTALPAGQRSASARPGPVRWRCRPARRAGPPLLPCVGPAPHRPRGRKRPSAWLRRSTGPRCPRPVVVGPALPASFIIEGPSPGRSGRLRRPVRYAAPGRALAHLRPAASLPLPAAPSPPPRAPCGGPGFAMSYYVARPAAPWRPVVAPPQAQLRPPGLRGLPPPAGRGCPHPPRSADPQAAGRAAGAGVPAPSPYSVAGRGRRPQRRGRSAAWPA